MTREQIRNKYGITQLEHPSIVNKELSGLYRMSEM